MKFIKKRKCLHCRTLFRPDRYNHHHQSYCSKRECQKARKKKNRIDWKSMEENSDYFKGQWNIDRVKEWRARNPGYSKRKKKELPLQTAAFPERVEDKADTKNALQNFDSTQLFLLVGLISHITGDALQTVVLKRANYFILKGQTLLNPDLKMKGVLSNGEKNHFVGTKAENPHPI